MTLLFTSTVTETRETKIQDTNFLEHYPSVNGNMNWLKFKPYIRQASDDVMEYISAEFYDVLTADTSETDDAGITSLKERIRSTLQDAIAYLSVYKAMPFLNIVIADMGVQQGSSENGTSQPTNQWRYKNTRWSALIQYYNKLDQLLALMEENISETLLDKFKTSKAYTVHNTLFFKHTEVLSQYLDIANSRRTFISMLPHLRKAQRDLRVLLCHQAYDELLTKLDQDDNSDEYDQLIELSRHYLANRALYLGIPHLRVLLEGNGIQVVTQTDTMDIKNPANEQMVKDLLFRAEQDAASYKSDIIGFLRGNLEVFLAYKEHGYVEGESRTVFASGDKVGGILLS